MIRERISNEEGREHTTNSKKHRHNKKPYPFNFRTWVPNVEIDPDDTNLIRVMTYNILADSLLPISTQIIEEDLEKLPYMNWENRRKTILNELSQLNPDIVCLQEFERDEEFIKELWNMGYDCAFKPRPGEHSEGCAVLWKFTKFSIDNLLCLEMNMNNGTKNISPIYDRDNVCIFAILKSIHNPEKCFIVANTHLLFNSNRGDVKLGQVYQILGTLNKLQATYHEQFKHVNLILCGDFNSIPNSAVYKFITEGVLNCNKIDKKKISGQGMGNLQYLNPNRLKTSLISSITKKFTEQHIEAKTAYDNKVWFNDILKVETHMDPEQNIITLRYKDNYTHQDSNLNLLSPLIMKSTYSETLMKILMFMKNPNGELRSILPFSLFKDRDIINNIEVNSIKMGYAEIEKTFNFVKNLTLEPPMTFYSKGRIETLDYIFFHGDLTPIRILNLPDVNFIAFDEGYLPTGNFPSDHISLCADFYC